MNYYYGHILRTLNTVVRVYNENGTRQEYYGYDEEHEPLFCDRVFERSILDMARQEYPVVFSEAYPLDYGILWMKDKIIIVGPVNVSYRHTLCGGIPIRDYMKREHHTPKEWRIPVCHYSNFCEEILMLFYAGTGKELTFQQLNELNYLNEEMIEEIKKSESDLMFAYQEDEHVHNPYSREQRIMDGIRKGNPERLISALDEVFAGEYGWLAEDELRSAKNLAIVGSGLAARAAIEGGIPFEVSFSISDNYIRRIDKAERIGEVRALERQNHLDYVYMVKELKQDAISGNRLVEDCKNLIFRSMHSPVRVTDLANELCVTKEYLAKIFKKHTGTTVTDYIMKNKIQLAENMLIYSEYNVGQIGTYLGFCSQSHFDRTFKKYNQLSPIAYRNKYGNTDKEGKY